MKRRIQGEGFRELVTNCRHLRMCSFDSKSYKSGSADVETMLRSVQSVPGPSAEPVTQWLTATRSAPRATGHQGERPCITP
jgi:hypothetical protein